MTGGIDCLFCLWRRREPDVQLNKIRSNTIRRLHQQKDVAWSCALERSENPSCILTIYKKAWNTEPLRNSSWYERNIRHQSRLMCPEFHFLTPQSSNPPLPPTVNQTNEFYAFIFTNIFFGTDNIYLLFIGHFSGIIMRNNLIRRKNNTIYIKSSQSIQPCSIYSTNPEGTEMKRVRTVLSRKTWYQKSIEKYTLFSGFINKGVLKKQK